MIFLFLNLFLNICQITGNFIGLPGKNTYEEPDYDINDCEYDSFQDLTMTHYFKFVNWNSAQLICAD